MGLYSGIFNEQGLMFTLRNYPRILQNMAKQPLATGNFEGIHDNLLKMVDSCKKSSDVEYLRKDINNGINSLNKLKQNVKNVEDGETQNKNIQAWIDNGLTSKKIEDHIKWIKNTYRPAINNKAKSLKESSIITAASNDLDLLEFMIDDIKLQQEIFESVVGYDFKEVYAIKEGSDIISIHEGAVKNMIDGVVRALTNIKNWISDKINKFISLFKSKSSRKIELPAKLKLATDVLDEIKVKVSYRDVKNGYIDISEIQKYNKSITEVMKMNISTDDVERVKSQEFLEEILGKTIGRNSCTLSEYNSACLDYCFEKEKEVEFSINQALRQYKIFKSDKEIISLGNTNKELVREYDDAIKKLELYKNDPNVTQAHIQYYFALQNTLKTATINAISNKINIIKFEDKQSDKVYRLALAAGQRWADSVPDEKSKQEACLKEALNDAIDYEVSMNKY